MDFAELVVRDGDRVTASGLLLRNARGDWFQPVFPVAAVWRGRRGVRSVWRGAVRVAGADFDAVGNRFELDGSVEGSALVTGMWSGGRLEVEQQTIPPSRPGHSDIHGPPPRTVPGRWTDAQAGAVRGHLDRQYEHWGIYRLGRRRAGDGQPYVAARLVRVLPEIAAWAASLPCGILLLDPWLKPVRGDRGRGLQEPASAAARSPARPSSRAAAIGSM